MDVEQTAFVPRYNAFFNTEKRGKKRSENTYDGAKSSNEEREIQDRWVGAKWFGRLFDQSMIE